jgi:hypothetical protein
MFKVSVTTRGRFDPDRIISDMKDRAFSNIQGTDLPSLSGAPEGTDHHSHTRWKAPDPRVLPDLQRNRARTD